MMLYDAKVYKRKKQEKLEKIPEKNQYVSHLQLLCTGNPKRKKPVQFRSMRRNNKKTGAQAGVSVFCAYGWKLSQQKMGRIERRKSKKKSAGVPQESILRSMLWNIFYDRVLAIEVLEENLIRSDMQITWQ